MPEQVASAPRRTRPRIEPGYGISADEQGMLSWEWVTERLLAARNYWIVTTKPDGGPHAAPVWGLWREGAIVFSTSPSSRKGRNLSRDSRVVVHLESGDEVVIVEGVAEQISLADAGADEYEAKYGFRPEPGTDGVWLRVRPGVVLAWLERDFPRTATRFALD
jgi:PPOX class probable F420-dependent enzyme